MKNMSILVLAVFLAACASGTVTIKVPLQHAPSTAQHAQPITVEVNDLRAPGLAASTRTAAFGVPMGNVTFDPPEKELVRNALEVALAQQPQAAGLYKCEILEFGVNTKTTALYWDVIGAVRLRLKQGGREYDLSGTHTERTYIWPGEEIMRNVIKESMRKAVAGLAVSAR